MILNGTFRHNNFSSLLTSWNIAIRKAWHLPYNAHTYILPALVGYSARDAIYRRFLQLYKTMSQSKNSTVNFITKVFISDARSFFNQNIRCISKDWNVRHDAIVCDPSRVKCTEHYSIEQLHCISSIYKLNYQMHGFNVIQNFSKEEILTLYEYFATC